MQPWVPFVDTYAATFDCSTAPPAQLSNMPTRWILGLLPPRVLFTGTSGGADCRSNPHTTSNLGTPLTFRYPIPFVRTRSLRPFFSRSYPLTSGYEVGQQR